MRARVQVRASPRIRYRASTHACRRVRVRICILAGANTQFFLPKVKDFFPLLQVPIRILAGDFEAAEKTFGTDGANLDIYFGIHVLSYDVT